MRYRATLAYDGTPYQGFQRQREGTPTVQATVEAALTALTGEPGSIIGAGRTDSGVHATGQVIAFEMDWRHGEDALLRALNANLPGSVAILDVQAATDDFHPRFSALRRAYRYHLLMAPVPKPLLRHRAWVWVGRALDVKAMTEAAASLPGRRDFAALGTPPQGNNTVREIVHSQWTTRTDDDGDWLLYDIEADAFLYRMVRRTVGMLTDVGRGKSTVAQFKATLDSAEIARGVTIAPPQGLVLTRVDYPPTNEQDSVDWPRAAQNRKVEDKSREQDLLDETG